MGQSVKNNEINALDLLSGQEQRPLNLGVSLEMVIFRPLYNAVPRGNNLL